MPRERIQRRTAEDAQARLRRGVQQLLLQAMDNAGVNRTGLAKLLGVSKSAITQLLSGSNLNLSTVERALTVLGHDLELNLVPKDRSTTVYTVRRNLNP